MKKTAKRILSLVCVAIAAIMLLSSCSAVKIDRELEINISVLNGTTGFGAAKLISDTAKGESELNYKFTVESDAANITAGLINGSIDIAALPTNAAATVYNKTEGKVKIAAVNTLGVLYLVVNSKNTEITSLSELEGKTVYCPAQNPAFLLEAICRANGLIPGENITIDTGYAQPADLRTAVASGQVDIAVLPEPMVTIAKAANSDLVTALDLTDEWEKAYGENTLMQGCIVVRTEWAENHPKELEEFLADYKASIEFTTADPAEAAVCITESGVFAGKAPVAAKAIPNCNIVYIDGKEMADALDVFFEKLYAVKPAAVGGKLPDGNIYYLGND